MKVRAVLATLAIVLVPVLAPAQEENRGYDKTDPIVLAVDREYSGTTDSDQERKYFMAHVEADVEYRLDMTGLSVDLDIYYLGSDDTFLRDSVGRSTNAEDNDERIQFTPKEDAAYFMLHNYDYKESEFKLMLTRSQTYADEVAALTPIRLHGEVSYGGQVGSRSSLYELGGLTPGSTYRIFIDGMQVNADLLVFSDPLYRDELARSNKRYTEGDFVTVSTGSDVLYVEVRGQHRSGTPFTLTVEERDRLEDQGSADDPMEIPVGEEDTGGAPGGSRVSTCPALVRRQASTASKAVTLRVSRLSSTPIRWIGSPRPRYLSAYPRSRNCASAEPGGVISTTLNSNRYTCPPVRTAMSSRPWLLASSTTIS